MDFTLMDADGKDLRPEIEVMINGKDVGFHTSGMNTELKDKDSVVVNLVPLGGG